MRNQKRRPALHQPFQGFENELFRPGVDGAGRFVKNQDLGVLQQGPGNGDSLTLTAGEGRAPFADDRVVAFGQRHDELVGIGGACGRLDVSAGGARATVGNIFGKGQRKQEWLLEHDGDALAQAPQLNVPHVLAIHQHTTLPGVEEARDQVYQRGLARAGGADDGQRLSGMRFH